MALILQRDSGIRNEDIEQNGVCPPATGTLYPLNTQPHFLATEPNGSCIASVFSHAAAMPAWTCDLIHLQTPHYFIVNIRGNKLEVLCLNCYHKTVRWLPYSLPTESHSTAGLSQKQQPQNRCCPLQQIL